MNVVVVSGVKYISCLFPTMLFVLLHFSNASIPHPKPEKALGWTSAFLLLTGSSWFEMYASCIMNEAAQDVRAVHPQSTWAKQRCPFCHGDLCPGTRCHHHPLTPSCKAFKLTTHIHLVKVDSKKWHCPLRHKAAFMELLMIGWKLWLSFV